MTDAPPLEYQPPHAAACMILMHGLGASGEDLHPLAPSLAGGRLRVVSPHAPIRAVTVNNGWQMRAWYDIVGVDLESRQDAEGVRASTAVIEELIAAEKKRGFAAAQIFLGGFSQGAADAAAANRQTPIFQAHGGFDAVVLPQWARASRDVLQDNGYSLAYQEYPMAHAIMPDELSDLNRWLQRRLAAISPTDGGAA